MMRASADYWRNLGRIHLYVWYVAKVFLLFRRPIRFLRHYVARTRPSEGVVEFRDGLRIHLSDHPHDVITVFVIFVRRDYGEIPSGSTVLDVGANIGVFALYAARAGAHAVHAFEPNTAAYEYLQRNVRENGLEQVIRTYRLAVSGRAGDRVNFPVAASVYNRIADAGSPGEFEVVETTSLRRILEAGGMASVDLLKLDCEGAEYGILMGEERAPLERVGSIRMEYHEGRADELVSFLEASRFEVQLLRPDSEWTGNLWARNASPLES